MIIGRCKILEVGNDDVIDWEAESAAPTLPEDWEKASPRGSAPSESHSKGDRQNIYRLLRAYITREIFVLDAWQG